MEKIKKIFCRS